MSGKSNKELAVEITCKLIDANQRAVLRRSGPNNVSSESVAPSLDMMQVDNILNHYYELLSSFDESNE